MRRFILCLVVLACTIPASAAADVPRPTCPPGYDIGPLTFAQVLDQGLYQEALEGGFITEAELAAGFDRFDANANGINCFKHWLGGRAPFTQYLIIDDPGGNPG